MFGARMMPLFGYVSLYLSFSLPSGLMARKVHFVVQWFARALSTKQSKSYGEMTGWAQTRLSFAVRPATNKLGHAWVKGELEKGQAWKNGWGSS